MASGIYAADGSERTSSVITSPAGVVEDLGAKLDTLTSGNGKTAIATFTCGTTAYAASDVSGGALTFANMLPAAGELIITSAALEIDATALISGETSYRLYLYNVTPPSALADSAAWDLTSGDRASFLGVLPLGTPVDLGSTLYVETNIINKQITLAGANLYAYLVSDGAYTPTARVFKITLHGTPI